MMSKTSFHILKVSRLEGLYDGIFAIAMTILVLDLKVPTDTFATNLHSTFITDILIKLFVYIGSFAILGTLWIAMNFQIGLLERINRIYLWTNVVYLMVICIVPFSASLLAAFPQEPISIIFYAINLMCASLMQILICESSCFYNLNKDIYSPAIRSAVLRRALLAPVFYLLAIFLAFFSTTLAFVILVAPILIYIVPGHIDKFDK